jgi:hypothetical protein
MFLMTAFAIRQPVAAGEKSYFTDKGGIKGVHIVLLFEEVGECLCAVVPACLTAV